MTGVKKIINIKNNKYSQAILFLSGNTGAAAAVAACVVIDSGTDGCEVKC
jgi:hypothetical protein